MRFEEDATTRPRSAEELKAAGKLPIALGKNVEMLGSDHPVPSADTFMRSFDGGATRHTDAGKLDYEGFLSPAVLTRYAQYLDEHRVQADGQLRDSDNWQNGIPLNVYMKSQLRHTFDQWGMHRDKNWTAAGGKDRDKELEDAICAVLFNASGYLYEVLRGKTKDA